MASDNPISRNGMLAGGIAMMAALLAMQLISRVLGPRIILTEYFAPLTYSKLIGLTGEFARFLMSGGGNFSRIVIFLVVIFLLAGAGLGRWVNANADMPGQRAMQAAAIVLFVTLILLYVADSAWHENFLQEIAITIALSCLVFAFMLNWLLEKTSTTLRWRIGGVISLMSLIVIVHDMQVF